MFAFYLITLALLGSLIVNVGIGIIPVIGIAMIAFYGIVKCLTLMLDSFAGFFGVDRQTAILAHVLIVATFCFPYLFPLWIGVALVFFRRDSHA